MRLLGKGRSRLENPNLYAYEAGAIYENQRDYAHAIDEYVKGALSGAPDSSAELRLLELARRPKYRDLVEQSTAKLAPTPNPPMAAVYLRVKVLEVAESQGGVSAFLDSSPNRRLPSSRLRILKRWHSRSPSKASVRTRWKSKPPSPLTRSRDCNFGIN